jgi:AcrR family transcriptional regulator
MDEPVKPRSYRSAVRAERALETRRRILRAARTRFRRDGWAATTVAAIAADAQVSVDTVYASVGRKPQLLLAVIDMTLADSLDALPAEQRGYVQDVRAARAAADKLAIYAAALARLLPQVAPLQEALRQAGEADADCAAVWHQLVDRRAANMRLFAADLRGTGELRPDLDDDTVGDIVWATNSVEFFSLLALRGWHPSRFEAMLVDLWTRVLLVPRRGPGDGHP